MFVYLVDGNCTIMNFRSIIFRLAILVMMGLCSIVATPSVGQYSDLRERALSGDAYYQYKLGQSYYYYSEGSDQSYDEGIHWFRLSAAQGFPRAQSELGRIYYLGEGVEQDHSEAVRWWRLAAEQGYAPAQRLVGLAFELGVGVAVAFVMIAIYYAFAARPPHIDDEDW